MAKQTSIQLKEIQQALNQAGELIHTDTTSGLELAQKAQSLFQALDHYQDDFLEAEIHLILGKLFVQQANFPKAYQRINEALALFEKIGDIDKQIDCWHVLSTAHFRFGEPNDSLQTSLRTLELLKQSPNKALEARAFVGLGVSYNQIGDYEQERISYQRAEEIYADLDEPSMYLASLKNNQAMVHKALGEYDSAFNYVEEAISILEGTGIVHAQCITFCSAAEICVKQERFAEAEQYLQQSDLLCNPENDPYGQIYIHQGFCELYMAQHRYAEANAMAHKARESADLHGVVQLRITAHKLLAQSYKELGAYELALTHSETYHDLHQQNHSDKMQHRLVNLRVIHETEKAQKSAEISELKSVILEQEIQKRKEVEESLRETNEELQAFAHMVAHDLRSPLSSISMGLELMVLMVDQWPIDKVRERLVRMHGIAKQTAGVIDDLLILATSNHDEVVLEPLDMNAILSDVLAQIELLTNEYNGEIILPDSWCEGMGYEPWVAQIWSNLISNGIKYGGRPYRVVLGSENIPDNLVRYWVDDNGAGIDSDKRDEVFKPFIRLDPKFAAGTGLGLTIVHKIVERLNGRIGVEKSGMGGSRFYFELPR